METGFEVYNDMMDLQEKAEKQARKRLFLAGRGQFVGGKEKNRLKEVLGSGEVPRLTKAKKQNRNAKCTCGSGKKFKNCCGR